MSKKNIVIDFDPAIIAREANLVSDKIIKLQKSKAAMDQVVKATTLAKQIDGNNKAVLKEFDANTAILGRKQSEVRAITQKLKDAEALTEKKIAEMDETLKNHKAELRKKLNAADLLLEKDVKEIEKDAEIRVSNAKLTAAEAEKHASEMVQRKRDAEKAYNEFTRKVLV